MGNSGGLLVLAPHKTDGPTDEVLLSHDAGACWDSVRLPEAIMVDNIRCV